MQVHIRGKASKINLTKNDFVTRGGEGSIYSKHGIIYKIYHDPSRMIPEGKINELSALSRDEILIPMDIICEVHNKMIGFTMKEVKKTEALCKLFTNDFWNRNGITTEIISGIVEKMRDTISFIHDRKCLIVDGNEFNYLIDDKFRTPYFIDVDSYQTPSYPATAIMPSIRDYQNSKFSELTDWFSFAIVSCQLFVGMHPFKGKHPSFKKNDFEARIKANVSIFNKDVSIPSIVRNFNDHIPDSYMEWFLRLFEKGLREPAPDKVFGAKKVTVQAVIIKSGDHFVITMLKDYGSEILFYGYHNGNEIVKLKDRIEVNGKILTAEKCEVVFTSRLSTPVTVQVKNGKLILKKHGKIPLSYNMDAEDMMIVENHIYVKNNDKLIDITVEDFNSSVLPTIILSKNIMPKATTLCSGVVYQNVLGKPYFLIPVPGEKKIIEKEIPKLEGFKIINAKHINHVLVVTCHDGKTYSRFVLRFSRDYSEYDVKASYDIDLSPVNFAVLDKGVVIMIQSDDTVEVFLNDPKHDKRSTLKDKSVNSSMRLYHKGNKALFAQHSKLYELSMR